MICRIWEIPNIEHLVLHFFLRFTTFYLIFVQVLVAQAPDPRNRYSRVCDPKTVSAKWASEKGALVTSAATLAIMIL